MESFDLYKSIPLGSLVVFPENESKYLDRLVEMPPGLADLLMAPKTGAFLRGIVRNAIIDLAKAPDLAYIVLKVGMGEVLMAKLAATISGLLQLPNDKAQKMAAELEHDLFAPVAVELNQYLETKKQQDKAIANKATGNPRAAGATNVLDLKDSGAQRRPVPPPLPRKFTNQKPQKPNNSQ